MNEKLPAAEANVTTTDNFFAEVEAVAAAQDFGKASAAKRGRNPEYPYVPIIDYGHSRVATSKTQQIRGYAFPDRALALAHAEKTIEFRRSELVKRLKEPRYRALRESFGLPAEVPNSLRPAQDEIPVFDVSILLRAAFDGDDYMEKNRCLRRAADEILRLREELTATDKQLVETTVFEAVDIKPLVWEAVGNPVFWWFSQNYMIEKQPKGTFDLHKILKRGTSRIIGIFYDMPTAMQGAQDDYRIRISDAIKSVSVVGMRDLALELIKERQAASAPEGSTNA